MLVRLKKSLVILCLSCLATLLKFIILGFFSFQLVILDFLGKQSHLDLFLRQAKTSGNISKYFRKYINNVYNI